MRDTYLKQKGFEEKQKNALEFNKSEAKKIQEMTQSIIEELHADVDDASEARDQANKKLEETKTAYAKLLETLKANESLKIELEKKNKIEMEKNKSAAKNK